MTASFTIRTKFAADNAAGRLYIAAELPALKGSEKQVSWAGDIRATKQVEFAEQIAKAAGVVMGVAIIKSDVDHIAACEAQLDAFLADPKFAQAIEQTSAIFSIADARFWIDNRAGGLQNMAASAAAYLKSA